MTDMAIDKEYGEIGHDRKQTWCDSLGLNMIILKLIMIEREKGLLDVYWHQVQSNSHLMVFDGKQKNDFGQEGMMV